MSKGLLGIAILAASAGNVYAQAAQDCVMGGNCVKSYIAQIQNNPIMGGALLVTTKDVHYCISQASATSECEGDGITSWQTVAIRCDTQGPGYFQAKHGQPLAEPNSRPSHATEWADQLWRAVCRSYK